jgi:glycosyltransferase 2 family protein
MKKKLLNGLYLASGFAILFFLFKQVDPHQMKAILTGADPLILAVMIVLALSQFVLATVVWNLLLIKRGIRVPFWYLVRVYLAGNFLCTMLPTKYTGDIYRTYAVSKRAGSFYDGAAAVLLERLSGIFVLVLMGFIAALFRSDLLGDQYTTYFMVTFFAGLVTGTWLIFSRPLFRLADHFLGLIRLNVLRRPMTRFHEAIEAYRSDGKFLAGINGLAFVFKTLAFVCIYLAALSLDLPIPFVSLFLIMPLIYVLEALPISINGLGVREGAFVFFFSRVGLSYEQAFALSIVVLFGRMVCVAVGGIAFLIGRMDSVPRRPVLKPVLTPTLVGQGAAE